MKTYILTPREHSIIKEYLNTGKKLEGFRKLVYESRKLVENNDLENIENQLELLKYFLDKVNPN